ncbi:hypothetical protein [Rhodococcus sp. P1Y]|uniref:hypothetical protein n=1 Tax=Rhodococcus sp. P1Y TaxID=1302308 RepID=UPI001F3672B2|nr:hypothetical protein [Rhodococcus sp. P1Y]
MRSRSIAALLVAATLGIAPACSTSEPGGDVDSASSAATSTPQSPSEASEPGLVLDVAIEAGTVSPVNERFDAVVGELVTLRVDSDAEDELHIHSVPEHSFDVTAASGQIFEFTVDVPGTVAIELHHSGKTVANLVVRP